MSSPVVGSARIEYTADLARFARESDVAIRATVRNMVRQFEQGLTRINAAAGAGGRAAGNTFQQNVVNNVQNTNTRIVNIIRNPAGYSRAAAANADAFSRTIQARLEAAVRNLPKIKLDANSTAVDRELAQVRAKLAAASRGLQLGIGTDVVNQRVTEMETRLRALAANTTDVRVQVNTAAALAEIEAFKEAMAGKGKGAGDGFGDSFEREIRTKLQATLATLPEIKLTANSSFADREIAGLREKIAAIDNDIKLGLNDREAVARLEELKFRLARLTGPTHDIRVRANATAALAELRSVQLLADNTTTSLTNVGSVGASSGPVGTLVMIGAIIAALSTLGPLTAAATGGLLGVAGVAGVAALAVLGLQKQMAQKTGFGQEISDQIKTIVAEAQGLGQIAANAVGPAIRDVLSTTQRVIVTLGPMVEIVAGRLGGAVRLVGTTLLDAVQKATPLFVDVAGYIEDGAAALRRWVAGPSFETFLAYARQQLPIIIGYAKDFGKAIIDTLVALAPAGEGFLKILDLVAKGISAIAQAVTGDSGIFSGSASIFGRLLGSDDDKAKVDQATSQVDQLLASWGSLSTGAADLSAQAAPLENYVKITGDLVPALTAASGNASDFQVAVTGITDRLKAATPALAEFIETAGSYDAATAKAADTAKLLGDALTASRGNALDYATAMVGADTATQSFAKALHDNLASVAADGTLLGISHLDAAGKFVDASNQYSEGSSAIVSAFQAQVKAATDAATATYQNELATKDQATAANDALTIYKGYRQSLVDSAVAAGTARDTAEALADQYFAIPPDVDTFVKLLGQDNVTLAIQGLTDALNRLSDFIGAPKVTMNKADFDTNNRLVNGDLDYFNQRKVSADVDAITGPFNTKMGQANNSLDQFDGRYVGATVDVNDFASYKLKGITGLLLGLHDKTIYVNTVTGGNTGPVNEFGGVFSGGVRQYAYGGFNPGLAQKMQASIPSFEGGGLARMPMIAGPSNIARFAELSTLGEAFIPFNPDRRKRAVAITSQVANKFGYDLTKRGEGSGVTVVSQNSNGHGPAVHIENMPVTQAPGEDGQAFARRLSAELAWELASSGFAMAGT